MTRIDAYRQDSAYAFGELMKALDGVTEGEAWAVLPSADDDYLHSDGSIHGLVMHIATCKWAYGSISFRNTEIRWSDLANQVESFEPSWPAAVDFLKRGHDYWMSCLADLTEEDMDRMVPTNYKEDWPIWRMIQQMSYHDTYHAGQIEVVRYGTVESNVKPPSVALDIRTYCKDSKHW